MIEPAPGRAAVLLAHLGILKRDPQQDPEEGHTETLGARTYDAASGRLSLDLADGRTVELEQAAHPHSEEGFAVSIRTRAGQFVTHGFLRIERDGGTGSSAHHRMTYIANARDAHDAEIYASSNPYDDENEVEYLDPPPHEPVAEFIPDAHIDSHPDQHPDLYFIETPSGPLVAPAAFEPEESTDEEPAAPESVLAAAVLVEPVQVEPVALAGAVEPTPVVAEPEETGTEEVAASVTTEPESAAPELDEFPVGPQIEDVEEPLPTQAIDGEPEQLALESSELEPQEFDSQEPESQDLEFEQPEYQLSAYLEPDFPEPEFPSPESPEPEAVASSVTPPESSEFTQIDPPEPSADEMHPQELPVPEIPIAKFEVQKIEAQPILARGVEDDAREAQAFQEFEVAAVAETNAELEEAQGQATSELASPDLEPEPEPEPELAPEMAPEPESEPAETHNHDFAAAEPVVTYSSATLRQRYYAPLHRAFTPEQAELFDWVAETDTVQTYEHRGTLRYLHIDSESGLFYNQRREPISREVALLHVMPPPPPLPEPALAEPTPERARAAQQLSAPHPDQSGPSERKPEAASSNPELHHDLKLAVQEKKLQKPTRFALQADPPPEPHPHEPALDAFTRKHSQREGREGWRNRIADLSRSWRAGRNGHKGPEDN